MSTLDFWFEFGSTYSYPAAMRIGDAARAAGVTVRWQPFLLGPVFQSQGYAQSPILEVPAKAAYMWRDLARLCGKYGLGWQQPSHFPRTSVLGARIACSYADAPWLENFVHAVYRANFAEDRDVGDEAVIAACLRTAGQQAAAVIAHATSEAERPRLRAQGVRAAELGLFGAPSFVVNGELFWGQDRLEDALAWARR
ncbi:2-hydroxychromene-2-carboxylate isomerase [Solimonas marina]|uniref:2-hydroxychromene-2-carboxylate isomerase n=1 Tax=Solimonas marina TaxID=2714601 RepID=UPI00344C2B50